ncbi:MAG: 2-oxoacid:acceptor oxidoreductase subunit alpha [Thermoplasmata archaeon]|jgi:2-oxoglutarate ferredoxin oxidoreductase subunit alpha|nr:2-oxoacid:acceptor oxidoreductase subunit alpha [Thermoplasmata archaeon]
MTIPPGEYFVQGNDACVEGALASGVKFFAGYPITPSTEIAEGLAQRLKGQNGVFLQMEDEIACISAVIGASWGGAKAMTATSGPGFSLMQEAIGYAAMSETPVVLVNVMRGGPSTGQPTKASQGDVMQTKWGSHGDYQVIAFAPATVQEMFDLTVECFNYSEKYRVPAFLLSDAEVGHMRGLLRVPEKLNVIDRKEMGIRRTDEAYDVPDDLVKPFPVFGKGHKAIITGMTHTETGRIEPEDSKVHSDLVRRLNEKVLRNRKDINKWEMIGEGSKTMIISYGSSALGAKEVATKDPNVGLLRLKSIWPLPEEPIAQAARGAQRILVCEMNLGQLFFSIKRVAQDAGCKQVELLSKLGGEPPTPSEVRHKLRSMGAV